MDFAHTPEDVAPLELRTFKAARYYNDFIPDGMKQALQFAREAGRRRGKV